MKEIFENQYYQGTRSADLQQTIDLITDYFPESGLPRVIGVTQNYIVIGSQLVNLSLGYKHRQYDEDPFNSNRICVYNRSTLTLITILKVRYPVNSVLFYNEFLLVATGIYGEVGGQLLQYNFQQDTWRTCSERGRALSFLTKQQGKIYVLSTGYEEPAMQLYELNVTADLFLHYNEEANYTLIPEDDEYDTPSAEMKVLLANREESVIPAHTITDTVETLTTLINKGAMQDGYFYACTF